MPRKSRAIPKDDSKVSVIRLEVRGNLKRFFNNEIRDESGAPAKEVILDGPAGTGKTRIMLERQHLIQWKYPGARGFVGRKYRSSMNETCLEVLNNEVFKDPKTGDIREDAPRWRERDQKYVYENGSEIIVGGMDDPQKLMSSKYDWIYFNESIEIKLAEWQQAMSRLRNFKVPYQQMLGDTNPGPPSHWIKQRGDDGRLHLLPTFHTDNPVYWDIRNKKWTAKGRDYIEGTLGQGLSGIYRARLYEGKWIAAEGQVYTDWNPEIHVVKRFPVPRHWIRVWVFDFGYVDPFVWQEWVQDPDDGSIYLHRELYHSYLRVEQAAKIIKNASPGIIPYALVCDHDAENRATLEKELDFSTLTAYKAIHPGIQAVQNRLKNNPHSGKPMLYIMEQPGLMVDPMLKQRHKPTSTEAEWEGYCWDTGKITLDKYKDLPVDKDNHGMDTARYAVAFFDDVAVDPQDIESTILYNDYDEYDGYDDGEYGDPQGSISAF